jgi:hypothetical protein
MHSYDGMPSALTEAVCDVEPDTAMPAPDVVVCVASEFGLNNKQQVAYRMICDFFIARYVNRQIGAGNVGGQLTMLMTGPGGTGKTHVVKAV